MGMLPDGTLAGTVPEDAIADLATWINSLQ
jgi:hypothetical protein